MMNDEPDRETMYQRWLESKRAETPQAADSTFADAVMASLPEVNVSPSPSGWTSRLVSFVQQAAVVAAAMLGVVRVIFVIIPFTELH